MDTRRRLLVAAVAAIAVTSSLAGTAGAEFRPAVPSPGLPNGDRSRGLTYDGLEPGGSTCPHGYAVRGRAGLCSHGPDAADAGIDVRTPRSTTELAAATSEGTSATSSGSVPCYGDGTTGNRVQVVYAHAADVPDRGADVAPLIAQWAANVDAVFNDSAAETGGVRHVRWVTDASCNLVVQRVRLSASGDDGYDYTVSELDSIGLKRTDRKYLVWVDATMYCGIAGFVSDDSASSRNANNSGPGYARIDTGCWGLSNPVEAHELMHTLGGVQFSAPHGASGHCSDESDRMCYDDGSGIPLTYGCAASHERLFDCNHDDYFSTSPPTGSYLATHWNTAMSTFLEVAAPTSSGGTSATTSTTTYSGSLTRKVTSRSYAVTAPAGSLAATLTFSKASSLTLTMKASDGTVIGQQSGPSGMTLSSGVAAGSYTVVVSGATSASFTLSITTGP